ncbi:MAG: monovalent cation/H(+) antiporter subunit G [Anaerolineales bacterium]|nr:monovalent cation/H(+) antiporter subunit G [Anaerolineales bacterium]
MGIFDWISSLFIIAGLVFFSGGTIGLLRFPDVFTRLHALTKADNLGLGLIIIGLVIQSSSVTQILKLILIWMLVLIASSTVCYMIANNALQHGIKPWKK